MPLAFIDIFPVVAIFENQRIGEFAREIGERIKNIRNTWLWMEFSTHFTLCCHYTFSKK